MQNVKTLKKLSANHLGVLLCQFRSDVLLQVASLKIPHRKED